MERLTRVIQPNVVVYIGKHKNYDADIPAEMSVAGVRELLCKVAAYEDTGLTPEQVAAQRWISVKERLPEMKTKTYNDGIEIGSYEISDIVLGYATDGTNGYAVTGHCERDRPGEIFWAEDCGTCHEITHWMCLPEPPKEQG